MDITFRIGQLLKMRGLHWKDIPISPGTLHHCKKTGTWTTDQLRIIADVLGLQPFELLLSDADRIYTEAEVQALLQQIREDFDRFASKKKGPE